MATGQKISAQTAATSFDSGDIMTIVQAGVNKSADHDVLFRDPQICKAWVNYNQSTNTVVDSYNIASVSDDSTGIFTCNFTVAMNNTNYIGVPSVNASDGGSNTVTNKLTGGTYTASAMQFITQNSVGTNLDGVNNFILFFGS